jgi:hypothetical protein
VGCEWNASRQIIILDLPTAFFHQKKGHPALLEATAAKLLHWLSFAEFFHFFTVQYV